MKYNFIYKKEIENLLFALRKFKLFYRTADMLRTILNLDILSFKKPINFTSVEK